MCMTFGSTTHTGGSFVCTDTRIVHGDGGASDCGGKVFSTGSGWATGAGTYPPYESSMNALKAAGPVPSHFDPSNRVQYRRDVANRAEAIAFDALADVGGPEFYPRNHMLVIEPHTGVILLTYRTGEVHEMYAAGDAPLDLGAEWPTMWAVMYPDVVHAGEDLASRIRVVAAHFQSAALRSYDMSNTMEIGYLLPNLRRGFLRGKARDIANARVEDILERFAAAPLEVSPAEAATKASRGARFYIGRDAGYYVGLGAEI